MFVLGSHVHWLFPFILFHQVHVPLISLLSLQESLILARFHKYCQNSLRPQPSVYLLLSAAGIHDTVPLLKVQNSAYYCYYNSDQIHLSFSYILLSDNKLKVCHDLL